MNKKLNFSKKFLIHLKKKVLSKGLLSSLILVYVFLPYSAFRLPDLHRQHTRLMVSTILSYKALFYKEFSALPVYALNRRSWGRDIQEERIKKCVKSSNASSNKRNVTVITCFKSK